MINENNLTEKLIDKKSICILSIIGILAISIRLIYTPFNLPITLDGLAYFFYANDLSILGHFPYGPNFPNNAWPTFLSIFFYIIPSDNVLDYMATQRIVSIVISTITIFPVYLLCRRFVGKFYSVIGASLFALEPRLIINSILGITEASYLLLGITSLFLFLSKNMKIVYLSFGIAALFALVRYEGLLIIIPFSIMFFIRFRGKKFILKYFLALGIFILVLLPMTVIRIDTTGQDGFLSHVSAGAVAHSNISQYPINEKNNLYFLDATITTIINLVKFSGWITIPTFIIFIVIAFFVIISQKKYQNIDHKKLTIILYSLFMLIPSLYAFSREFHETRYLYILFPVFSLLTVYSIQLFEKKIKKRSLIFTIMIIGIVVTSIGYLEIKGLNVSESEEQYELAKIISQKSNGINQYSGIEYIKITHILNNNFPILKNDIIEKPIITYDEKSKSLEEFIKAGRENQLTHIIIEKESLNQPEFISKLFINYKGIPYLSVELDSKELGFSKELKLLRINYEIFDANQMAFQ
ncbi:ArnT family glycosyltransferase [Nitrosopumilus sp.]|uniref:ArnT family glycosyltransferase n=1 Tax=Nitrosopumilus sp. TaxID=2024843 RepID=UPI00349FF12E